MEQLPFNLMKNFFGIFFFSLCASVLNAQSISGSVTDKSDNSALFGVTIVIKGTTYGAVTDLDGNYEVANIPAGTYNIEASTLVMKQHFTPASS